MTVSSISATQKFALQQWGLPEVFQRGPKYLLSPLLSLCITDAENVTHESSAALAVWQLVGVYISNCADDALGQRIIIQL